MANTDARKRKEKIVYDHKGNPFPSMTAMSRAYGLTKECLHLRLNHYHMSLEEALTRPVVFNRIGEKKTMSNGQECEIIAYKSYKDITVRFSDGTVLEHVGKRDFDKGLLHTDYGKMGSKKWVSVTDFEGNVFRTTAQMCKHWGINQTLYQKNLNSGMTQKEALLYHPNEHQWETVEYGGKTYSSVRQLSEKLGVEQNKLRKGLKKGMTVDEILDFDRRGVRIMDAVRDPEGRLFPSLVKMCEAHGVSYGRYKHLVRKGYSQKEALNPNFSPSSMSSMVGIPVRQRNGMTLTTTAHIDDLRAEAVWEDGVKVIARRASLHCGTTAHPLLKMRGNCVFHGYKIYGKAIKTKDAVYYKAEDIITGEKKLLTPQEMMSSRKDNK